MVYKLYVKEILIRDSGVALKVTVIDFPALVDADRAYENLSNETRTVIKLY